MPVVALRLERRRRVGGAPQGDVVPRAGRPLRLARLGRLLRPPVPACPSSNVCVWPRCSPPAHRLLRHHPIQCRYFRFKTDGGKSGAGFEWWERLLFTRLEFYGTLFCSEALPFKRSLRRRVRDTRSAADGSSSGGGGGGGGASAAGGRVAAQFVVAGQDALGLDAAIAFAHGLQPPGAAPDGTNVI